MAYTIKGFRHFNGHDGQGFSLTLYRDGKHIGSVTDDGWGGGYQYHGVPDDAIAELRKQGAESFAILYPEQDTSPHSDIGCEDIAVYALIEAHQTERRERLLLRKAAKQVLFILDGDPDSEVGPQYRYFPARVSRESALTVLRGPEYAGKHPRVLNAATGTWDVLA